MSLNDIIMWVLAFGALVGGLDLMIGNRLGLGEKFEEGFHAMGPLALAMVGMICLAPVLADLFRPIVVPILTTMNADPAVFAGLIPNDAGGYPLAMQLAVDPLVGKYMGLLVGAMLGATLGLTIPLALGLLEKHDQPYFAKGLLLGIIVIPFGSFIGGLVGGFTVKMLFWNTLPILIFSILIVIGLVYIPDVMIKLSIYFGKLIAVVVALGLTAAAFKQLTCVQDQEGNIVNPGIDIINETLLFVDAQGILGLEEPVAQMEPIMNAMAIIGIIGIVLLGTFPTMALLIKALKKPLEIIGDKLSLDSTSTAGLIITLANPIPTMKMIKDMNSRGKILNCAFIVTCCTTLGDHLGFTAAMDKNYVTMMVIGKLITGAMAVFLTLYWTRSTDIEDRQSEEIRLLSVKTT